MHYCNVTANKHKADFVTYGKLMVLVLPEACNFECSVSGLHWVCKESVSFNYQSVCWEGHMERLETMQYITEGPLLDITVIVGKLDDLYLPHWICTGKSTSYNRKKKMTIDV